MDWTGFRLSLSLVFRRFTDGANKVVSDARMIANRHVHRFVTPEHILVSLAVAKPGAGQALLKRLGVDVPDAALALSTLLESIPRDESAKTVALSPAAAQVLELASAQSRNLGYRYVGTEHLLLGILSAGDSGAANYLAKRGITLAKAREELFCLRRR